MAAEVLLILTKAPLKIFLSLNIWTTFITLGLAPLILTGKDHPSLQNWNGIWLNTCLCISGPSNKPLQPAMCFYSLQLNIQDLMLPSLLTSHLEKCHYRTWECHWSLTLANIRSFLQPHTRWFWTHPLSAHSSVHYIFSAERITEHWDHFTCCTSIPI